MPHQRQLVGGKTGVSLQQPLRGISGGDGVSLNPALRTNGLAETSGESLNLSFNAGNAKLLAGGNGK